LSRILTAIVALLTVLPQAHAYVYGSKYPHSDYLEEKDPSLRANYCIRHQTQIWDDCISDASTIAEVVAHECDSQIDALGRSVQMEITENERKLMAVREILDRRTAKRCGK